MEMADSQQFVIRLPHVQLTLSEGLADHSILSREQSLEETWDGPWTDTSLSSIQSPPEVQRVRLQVETEMDRVVIIYNEDRT